MKKTITIIGGLHAQLCYERMYKELMEIGFDGLKMLEGKPTIHKKIGKNLNHPELDKLYAELEKELIGFAPEDEKQIKKFNLEDYIFNSLVPQNTMKKNDEVVKYR